MGQSINVFTVFSCQKNWKKSIGFIVKLSEVITFFVIVAYVELCKSLARYFLYAILILWMIWKMADPQTTKMNNASNQGPTLKIAVEKVSIWAAKGCMWLVYNIFIMF